MKKNRILILTALIIVITASYFASAFPDGLEFVADKMNFAETAVSAKTLFTDYSFPFINGSISTILAGCAGLILCFLLGYLLKLSLGLRKQNIK